MQATVIDYALKEEIPQRMLCDRFARCSLVSRMQGLFIVLNQASIILGRLSSKIWLRSTIQRGSLRVVCRSIGMADLGC